MIVTAPKRTLRRFLELTVIFAFFHWFLMIVSFGVVVGRGVHRLDHPEFPKTALEQMQDSPSYSGTAVRVFRPCDALSWRMDDYTTRPHQCLALGSCICVGLLISHSPEAARDRSIKRQLVS